MCPRYFFFARATGFFAAVTGVSHLAYFLFLPLTMSKNAFWIFAVIGPRLPEPMLRESRSRIGV